MKKLIFIFLNFILIETAHAGYPGLAVKNSSNNSSVDLYLSSEDYISDLNLFKQLIEVMESKLILKGVHLSIIEDPNGNSSGQTDLENKKILIKVPRSPVKCNEYCLRQILASQVALLILHDSRFPPAL